MARRLIHPSIKEQAIRDYVAGESSESIGKRIGVDPSAIRRWIGFAGLQVRSQAEAQRRCTLNEEAFLNTSREALYWAGFLVADGSICGSRELALVLAICDKPHVEKFKRFLGSSHKIIDIAPAESGYSSNYACRIGVKSLAIVESLRPYGFHGKSLERSAGAVSVGSRDFWRGVVDGDGHLGISRGKPRLQIIGGQALCRQFADYVNRITGSRVSATPSKGQTYVVQTICGTAEKMAFHLYGEASVSLDRKQAKAEEIITNAAQVNLIWARGQESSLASAESPSSTSCGSMKQLGALKHKKPRAS